MTVGAAGVGGTTDEAANSNYQGAITSAPASGGASSVVFNGVTVTAGGGSAGNQWAGGGGGTATNATFSVPGGTGGTNTGATTLGMNGGNSVFGMGAPVSTAGAAPGATGYGGGGGGGPLLRQVVSLSITVARGQQVS